MQHRTTLLRILQSLNGRRVGNQGDTWHFPGLLRLRDEWRTHEGDAKGEGAKATTATDNGCLYGHDRGQLRLVCPTPRSAADTRASRARGPLQRKVRRRCGR